MAAAAAAAAGVAAKAGDGGGDAGTPGTATTQGMGAWRGSSTGDEGSSNGHCCCTSRGDPPPNPKPKVGGLNCGVVLAGLNRGGEVASRYGAIVAPVVTHCGDKDANLSASMVAAASHVGEASRTCCCWCWPPPPRPPPPWISWVRSGDPPAGGAGRIVTGRTATPGSCLVAAGLVVAMGGVDVADDEAEVPEADEDAADDDDDDDEEEDEPARVRADTVLVWFCFLAAAEDDDDDDIVLPISEMVVVVMSCSSVPGFQATNLAMNGHFLFQLRPNQKGT